MILNLIHRPQLGKNYALYKLQQEYAHRLNLKTTILMDITTMADEQAVADALAYHKEFGDEIGLWLWTFHEGGAPFWLLSAEKKMELFCTSYDMFKNKLGFEPISVGSYVLDLEGMKMIRDKSPKTTTVIASCFEEGVKIFHGCNHSWYLFSEGGSWMPWYPSIESSLIPASSQDNWNGLVAIPHLSRDLALAFEGRNDFFASHPANVQRGIANKGEMHEYDYNLIDQYLMQGDYNNHYSYYNVHVSPSWLGDCNNVQDAPEVSQKIYYETLEYLSKLRDNGSILDMYMSEFGAWYKENIDVGMPQVALGKEMLYGSGKHIFWYIDSNMRVLIDANLGGSIGDLRPYAAGVPNASGPDRPLREMVSYPYVVHSQYRTGTVNHCEDGARSTLLIKYGNKTIDLCYSRTKVKQIEREGYDTILFLEPVSVEISDEKSITVETIYRFSQEGNIYIKRKLSNLHTLEDGVTVIEYFKGCYGYTEYPMDMNGIILRVCGAEEKELIYSYGSSIIETENAQLAEAVIPQIHTRVSLSSVNNGAIFASAKEGNLFSPFFTLQIGYEINQNEIEVETCLKIQKNQ